MSDTTTITPEERALWRKRFDSPFFDKGCKPFSLRALDALEDSERRVSELTAMLDASCEETRQNFSALYKTATEVIPALNAKIEQAEARAERAESAQLHLCQWLSDIAVELGCACDNEAMLLAAHEIKACAEKAEAENARLRAELETAKQVAASAQAVAQEAWAGEIPSPLPGHKRANEEELLAQVEHLNCPLCGGSGHIGDCEGD